MSTKDQVALIGKKPSGAANRKAKRDREKAERAKTETETGARAALLEMITPPPIDDPQNSTPWFQRAQMVLLGELIKDPQISVRELFTAVKQMSEAAAKTRNPADVESRLSAVEDALADTRASDSVEVKATHGLERPSTARGGKRARGPRPMEEPPSGSDRH